MKLFTAYVHNFKRFEGRHKLNLLGDVIALIGPNEAGKTSLLRALESINEPKGFNQSARTRNAADPAYVELHFLVEDEDREAISHIPGSSEVSRISFKHREEGGPLIYSLYGNPSRDLSVRRKVKTQVEEMVATQELSRFERAGAKNSYTSELAVHAIEALASEEDDLNQDHLEAIRTFASRLKNAIEARRKADKFRLIDDNCVALLNELSSYEEEPSPSQQIADILASRRPMIWMFDDAARTLRGTYDLSSDQDLEDQALNNLASLAGLDLTALRDAIDEGAFGEIEAVEEQANEALKQTFSESHGGRGR